MQVLTYHTRIHQLRKSFLSRVGKRGDRNENTHIEHVLQRKQGLLVVRGDQQALLQQSETAGEGRGRERKAGGGSLLRQVYITSAMVTEEETTQLLRPTGLGKAAGSLVTPRGCDVTVT